jgi:hypothetical protein
MEVGRLPCQPPRHALKVRQVTRRSSLKLRMIPDLSCCIPGCAQRPNYSREAEQPRAQPLFRSKAGVRYRSGLWQAPQSWLAPLPAQPPPLLMGTKNWAVSGAKVTPKQFLDATTVREPTRARAASVGGGFGRVSRGTTQDSAMFMRCPDARANVSRRTTRLSNNSGCRDDKKTFVQSA